MRSTKCRVGPWASADGSLLLRTRGPASFRFRTCGADPLVAIRNGHGLVIVATCGLPVEALFAAARSDREHLVRWVYRYFAEAPSRGHGPWRAPIEVRGWLTDSDDGWGREGTWRLRLWESVAGRMWWIYMIAWAVWYWTWEKKLGDSLTDCQGPEKRRKTCDLSRGTKVVSQCFIGKFLY